MMAEWKKCHKIYYPNPPPQNNINNNIQVRL